MADPKVSEGARLERRSFRDMLRRRVKANPTSIGPILDWVLKRQKRYDRKPGGIGK